MSHLLGWPKRKLILQSCSLAEEKAFKFIGGVSTPSTLMATSTGSANPEFSKSGRKPKKTKHCTIPKNL